VKDRSHEKDVEMREGVQKIGEDDKKADGMEREDGGAKRKADAARTRPSWSSTSEA
jgi:hypothetical protein